jgi:hypothetical protein
MYKDIKLNTNKRKSIQYILVKLTNEGIKKTS